MAFKRFTVSNVNSLSNSTPAMITGKNGFITQLGIIPILIDTYNIIDGSANIQLTCNNLSALFDYNFGTHILNVNNGFFTDLKGLDYIQIEVNEKSNSGNDRGFVAFNAVETSISANILSHNLSSNTIVIENTFTNGARLADKIVDAPFYAKLSQILNPRYFTNNEIYISGSNKSFSKYYNISGSIGNYTAELPITPRYKKEITVWLDGELLSINDFTWDNLSNIELDVDNQSSLLRVVVDTYLPPVIEQGDNISLFSSNVFSVSNVSYDALDNFSNSFLTSNNIYKIKLQSPIRSNVSGVSAVNKSLDIIGTINNVYSSNNTFTVDYNSSIYPGNFNLANNKLYRLQVSTFFTPITLSPDRIIRDVPTGLNIVRARNKNIQSRSSEWVTRQVTIEQIPMRKVQNLTVTENLFKDTSQGISVRAIISFDHIINQEVTDYEISYKLNTDSGDLSNFNTVKVPSVGVDTDGKIRFVIENVNRGLSGGVNQIIVRVTPLNKNIRGITAEITETIIGKSAAPNDIQTVSGGQQGQNIILIWSFLLDNNGFVADIDLNETVIRKYPGILNSSVDDINDIWNKSTNVAKVATPATSVLLSIDFFGTETYLLRTKDTSGNFSEGISILPITTTRPSFLNAYLTWSEDNPSGNVISFLPNENATENNYPSFTDSTNGGLSGLNEHPVDNANGSSSGWSVAANVTDLLSTSNYSVYTTQVRTLDNVITGTLFISTNGTVTVNSSYNDLISNVISGVTEASPGTNVLVDVDYGGIGTVLGYNNANAATVSYSTVNKTLTSGGSSGNVFAIWNFGQHSNDYSNSNSFALIAGVINANAIALGETYYANGEPTSSNLFANLITGTSYALVDLQQFVDSTGDITFSGPDSIITTTTKVRYSENDPFYANGNVNVSVFAATAGADDNGWKLFNTIKRPFKYFQIQYEVFNENPVLGNFELDKFEYSIDLEDKITKKRVLITSSPQVIDFSEKEFLEPPSISMTAESNSALIPVIVTPATRNNVSVNVYSNTGIAQTGINVNFTIIGV